MFKVLGALDFRVSGIWGIGFKGIGFGVLLSSTPGFSMGFSI